MNPRVYPTNSWVEQRASGHRTVVIPFGSLEQHGPHLPLHTDTLIAEALAHRVAQSVDIDVVPVIPVGASGEHAGFAGLLSIGNEALESVVLELLRSARDTWGSVVLVSGHGGNVESITRAMQRARAEGSQVVAWFPTDLDGDPHAGSTETSVMLAIDESLVQRHEFVDFPVSETHMEDVRRQGIMSVSPSGVLGQPSHATVASGQRILQRWTDEIVALVKSVEELS